MYELVFFNREKRFISFIYTAIESRGWISPPRTTYIYPYWDAQYYDVYLNKRKGSYRMVYVVFLFLSGIVVSWRDIWNTHICRYVECAHCVLES